MFKKILIGLFIALLAFLGFVSTKDGKFNYERNAFMNATPEKVFSLISTFEACKKWNPYDLKDPSMKRTMQGVDGQVGAVMNFDGNSEVGSGSLEMIRVVPNQVLELKLKMIKPFKAENFIEYKVTPEGTGTRFSWRMYGDGGFMGKLMSTIIDCEKMMTAEFSTGMENLKKLAELKP